MATERQEEQRNSSVDLVNHFFVLTCLWSRDLFQVEHHKTCDGSTITTTRIAVGDDRREGHLERSALWKVVWLKVALPIHAFTVMRFFGSVWLPRESYWIFYLVDPIGLFAGSRPITNRSLCETAC